MSTRKLILTALTAGLAILIAGAVMLIRLTGDDSATADLKRLGESARVGSVVVTPRQPTMATFVVRITLDDDAQQLTTVARRFRLLYGGVAATPTDPGVIAGVEPCADLGPVEAGTTVECALAWEQGTTTPYLRFGLDDEFVIWDTST